MSADDQVVLTEIVNQERNKTAPTMDPDVFFELFTAEQILKSRSFDLDQDQIRSGIVGGGNDGGVDSVYLFANRRLIRDDTDLTQYKDQQLDIDLIITQSKNSPSFSEKAVEALSDFVENCLRLVAKQTPESEKLYSQALRDAVQRFHTILKSCLSRRPNVSISLYYASLGEQIHDKVQVRREMLIGKIQEAFSTANIAFEFVGARELLQLAYRRPTKTFTLESKKHIPEGTSYVCLVQLGKFFEFINDNGVPRGHLFEANVRDYNGDVLVNREIAATLAVEENEQFWWLNNGITVIASDISSTGEFFSVTDPLIVNGLQTSYELHKHFQAAASKDDKRTILMRIIKTTDAQSIDRIIKATNSQTTIPRAWLHATEDIHRKIETTMRAAGLYYDRRKNYYRNQGVEPRRIVTIPYLSQALAAIVLQRPEDARSRPTTVAERHYRQLFPSSGSTEIYAKCALILKRVDEFLDGYQLSRGDRLNISFYMAMYATSVVLQASRPNRARIASVSIEVFTNDFLKEILKTVYSVYKGLGANDRVAKSGEFSTQLKNALTTEFSAQRISG